MSDESIDAKMERLRQQWNHEIAALEQQRAAERRAPIVERWDWRPHRGFYAMRLSKYSAK